MKATIVKHSTEISNANRKLQESFLIKRVGQLGPDKDDMRDIRVLNRCITWDTDGLRYQADPRHAEILARDMDIPKTRRAPTTPGAKVSASGAATVVKEEEEEDELLGVEDASRYRSWAARANYLAQDRPDLGYPAKELCRWFTAPRQSHHRALVRLVRYLEEWRWLAYKFEWQDEEHDLTCWIDTDFAGCKTTRRSTAGGMILLGRHLLKHWSSTQKTISLSSGEAEFGGIVRGASEALGMQSLAAELGLQTTVALKADAAAAIGICRRAGIGRIRHLAVCQLWVQDKLREGAFRLLKTPGTENCADILTKHVPTEILRKHMSVLPLEWLQQRARHAPGISMN